MRLAAPSWLRPGSWLENIETAASLPWLGAVEILLFEWDQKTRAVFTSELGGIISWTGRFKFSVHLPDPLGESALDIAGLCSDFARAFVLHPPSTGGAEDWADLVSRLREGFGDRFLLEYTGEDAFRLAESALPDLPLCPDTGKLLLDGKEPAEWIGARRHRVQALHLHAAREGRDHFPLDSRDAWLVRLLPLLETFAFPIELEVFSLEAVEASRAALEALA